MKKIISCLAVLAIMASAAGCGAKSEPTIPAAETTADVTTTAAETTAAADTESITAAETVSETTAAISEITLDGEEYLFGGYVALDSGSLSIFSTPDNDGQVLAEIPYATQLDIFSSGTDGWYMTEFDEVIGYIKAEYISEIESYEDDAFEEPVIVDRDEVAVSKIKDLNDIIRLTNVMDESDSTEGFVKVEDERFRSADDLRQFIIDTCSGEARDKFLNYMDSYPNCYMDKDGELYYKPAGRGFYKFITDGGVTVSDPAMDYFIATTNEDDEMNPFLRAVFHSEDGNWKIESYEYSYDGDFASETVKTGVRPEDFLGTWYCGRIWADISEKDGGYNVYIKWSWSAGDGIVYEYDCYYDDSTSTLRCDGGGTSVYYCADDAEPTETDTEQYEYSDGSAVFEIKDGTLYWTDGKDPSAEPQYFAR